MAHKDVLPFHNTIKSATLNEANVEIVRIHTISNILENCVHVICLVTKPRQHPVSFIHFLSLFLHMFTNTSHYSVCEEEDDDDDNENG